MKQLTARRLELLQYLSKDDCEIIGFDVRTVNSLRRDGLIEKHGELYSITQAGRVYLRRPNALVEKKG